MTVSSGFQELQHTADWALRVWAPSLESLFEQAALGMNALSGMQLADQLPLHRDFSCTGLDTESLLVTFLSELVYCAEQERFGFNHFEVHIEMDHLSVGMDGAPLLVVNKTIKAVTYHNMKIIQSKNGCEVVIVFDV